MSIVTEIQSQEETNTAEDLQLASNDTNISPPQEEDKEGIQRGESVQDLKDELFNCENNNASEYDGINNNRSKETIRKNNSIDIEKEGNKSEEAENSSPGGKCSSSAKQAKISLKQKAAKAKREADRANYFLLCDLATIEVENREHGEGKKTEIEAQIKENACEYTSSKKERDLVVKLSDRIHYWQKMGIWGEKDLEKWKEGTVDWGETQRLVALSLPKALVFSAIAHFEQKNIIPSSTEIREYREQEDKSILLEDRITDEIAKQRIVDRSKDPNFTRETLDEILKPALAALKLQSESPDEVSLTNGETKELLIESGYKPIRGFFRKSMAQRRAERKSDIQKLQQQVAEIIENGKQKPQIKDLLDKEGIAQLQEALESIGFQIVKSAPNAA